MAYGTKMSRWMRDILISHIDGPVPIFRAAPKGVNAAELARHRRTTEALVLRGLLRNGPENPPRETFVTELGRKKLAEVLGDWADALVRAGWGMDNRPGDAHIRDNNPGRDATDRR